MLRMEIALVLVLGFVAYMYDSAERTRTALHRTFSALLAATLVRLLKNPSMTLCWLTLARAK